MAPVATRLKPRGTWHVRFHFPHVKSTGFWTLFARSRIAGKIAGQGMVCCTPFYGRHVQVHAPVRCIPVRSRYFLQYDFEVELFSLPMLSLWTFLQRHFHSFIVQNFRDRICPNSYSLYRKERSTCWYASLSWQKSFFSNKVRWKMKIFNMESQWERLCCLISFYVARI